MTTPAIPADVLDAARKAGCEAAVTAYYADQEADYFGCCVDAAARSAFAAGWAAATVAIADLVDAGNALAGSRHARCDPNECDTRLAIDRWKAVVAAHTGLHSAAPNVSNPASASIPAVAAEDNA